MNVLTYLKTIRPLSLILWLVFPAQVWLLLLGDRPAWSWAHFIGGNFVLPMMVGLMFMYLVSEPMRRPFFMMLPGARRYFFRAHVVVVVISSALLIWYASYRNPSVPSAAAAGLIVASMSVVMIPRPMAFVGAPGLMAQFWAVVPVAALVWKVELIHAWTQQWPWLFAMGGACAAYAGFAIGYSKKRIREMALIPYRDPLSWWSDRKSPQEDETRRVAGAFKGPRGWLRMPVDGSLRSWMRVMSHAAPVTSRSPVLTGIFAVLILFTMVAKPFLTRQSTGYVEIPEMMRSALWGAASLKGWLGVLLCPLFAGLPFLFFPATSRLYPLSRKRHLQLALAMAARQWVLLAGSVAVFALGLGWVVCRLSGAPFVFAPAPIFALPLMAASVLPFFFLIKLHGAWMEEPSSRALSVLCLVSLWLVSPPMAVAFPEEICSGAGLFVLGAVTLTAVGAFVWYARKIFLRSDLVVRTT